MNVLDWLRRWTVPALAMCCLLGSAAAQETPAVKFVSTAAGPRPMEEQTARSVVRDYGEAWRALAEASKQSRPDLLGPYFVGAARESLSQGLKNQQKNGMRTRYLNQAHSLEALFYAPEGDILQLQDTADYQFRVLSDDQVVHDEHIVVRYIVLMTPGADRWVVRQIQAVPAQ
ncbi:MAG: hypothetical protein JST79_18450 [Acidobacteria bacterium]|nr:hypothetical protein [Acidobacteriota bacterium]